MVVNTKSLITTIAFQASKFEAFEAAYKVSEWGFFPFTVATHIKLFQFFQTFFESLWSDTTLIDETWLKVANHTDVFELAYKLVVIIWRHDAGQRVKTFAFVAENLLNSLLASWWTVYIEWDCYFFRVFRSNSVWTNDRGHTYIAQNWLEWVICTSLCVFWFLLHLRYGFYRRDRCILPYILCPLYIIMSYWDIS